DTLPPKISAHEVERVFESRRTAVRALGPISMDIADGEFLCIVGPSGCGKSTFLRIIAGLVKPTSGSVEIVHHDPAKPATAMVFQNYSLFPWRTVESNVGFGLEVLGASKREARGRTREWLDKLSLSDSAKMYPAMLSG